MRKDRDEPVYAIGVAARLVECHPQTLRTYEALGLLRPSRTESNLRLYSDHDLDRVRQIKRLTYVGINLPGVEVILDLLEKMEKMEHVQPGSAMTVTPVGEEMISHLLDRVEQMRQQMEAALAETQSE